MIPHDFQRDAIGGDTPTLSFCTNMTYFVPGTLSFKGFKTVAVTTAGSVVKTTLVGTGMADDTAQSLLQPVVPQVNPIGKPMDQLQYIPYELIHAGAAAAYDNACDDLFHLL